MKNPSKIIQPLLGIGGRKSLWCTAEVNELSNLLVDGEQITGLVKGWYAGGFALLLVTNLRILLVDKKPLFLGVEDIRYEMVCQIDYSWQWLQANVIICTVNKQLKFVTFDKTELRRLAGFVQQKILELRRQHDLPAEELHPIGSEPHRHLAPRQIFRRVGSTAAASLATHPYANNSLWVAKRF